MVYLPHWPIPSSFGKREIDYERVFERMSQILEKLENPHKKLPPTIHVTGTNGKGSVIAFLAEILRQAGLKVDVFTSPHLHHCNERIVIDSEKISDSYLYEIMEEARIHSHSTPLTFFEGFCIGAFLAFSKSNSDVLLMEAGMGARIDATNIIDKKLATIITPISFDHTEYLGNTIEKIAFEKAHILRPQTPVIIGPQPVAAEKIIEIIAADQNAEIIRYDKEFEIIKDQEINDSAGNFDLRFFDRIIQDLPAPNLAGDHQYINASIAISCALTLNFNINENHIRQALKKTFWPSRIEKIHSNFSKNKENEIFIDGAHNQAGAFALAKWILAQKKLDEKKNFIIVGFTKNKCKKEFLLNFANIADLIVAVRVDGEPNPESSEEIARIAETAGIKIHQEQDLLDAIYYLEKICNHRAYRIVICGSLHLARDVKKFMDRSIA